MDARIPRMILIAAAVICFLEVTKLSWTDPGLFETAVMGLLLVRRAITAARQPIVAVACGCVLTAVIIASDRGAVDIDNPLWIAVIIIAFVGFGFWERIEERWRG